jgi:hypothetical protein
MHSEIPHNLITKIAGMEQLLQGEKVTNWKGGVAHHFL